MSKYRDQLEAAVKALETFADELDAKGVAPSGEDIQSMKTRMDEIASLKEQVKSEADMRGEMADAKAFLRELGGDGEPAAKSEKFTASGLSMDTQGKTLGQLFTESDVYGDFGTKYFRGGTIPNQVKGIQSNSFQVDAKDLVTGGSATSGGAFVTPDRYGPVTDLVGAQELTIADLVTKGATASDTVEYVRVTSKTSNAATVAEATTAAGPTQDATVGPLVQAAGGGYKPESALGLEVISTSVKTIAHWIPITKRAAADAGQVRTLIDNFLLTGLAEELEDQILNGAGSGEDFDGIMSSGVQTVGSAGTDIDAVVEAIAKVRTVGKRKPNALVIHPNDWYSAGFLLAKNGVDGGYLIGDPRASIDQLNSLWGLKVVVTTAQPENTALVGDFNQAVLWARESASILVSDQHADFFTRNLLAVLAERRDAFGVLDPQAFCSITAV